jgi:hypothetical protein
MTRSLESRELRKLDIRQRSKEQTEDSHKRCALFGCSLYSMRAAGQGLSAHCRYHVQYAARHGSLWKRSYSATELAPFRKTARGWLSKNSNDKIVAQALGNFEALLSGAGLTEIATRLRGLKPQERARIAVARLREAKVPALRLLEVVLAVNMIILDDPIIDRAKQFRLYQVAKPCHRMASGYHKKWTREASNGSTITTEIHAYPKSSGRVLGYLGAELERCAEWVIEAHIRTVLAQKVKSFGRFIPAEKANSTPQPNPSFKPPNVRAKASSVQWRR